MAVAKRRSATGGGGPPTPPRNHLDIANKYITDVVSGTIPACKWVKLACQRQVNDLLRAKEGWKYQFDPAKAVRVCRFIENLPHTKGKWMGSRILLEPWQVFRLTTIFGWVSAETGNRRFRRAYNKVPRKNGKSLEGAGVGLYMLSADGEKGAEVYCGATNEKQAWEIFRPAKQIVERVEPFRSKFGITANANNLHRLADGSKFEPVIGKPGDGASPSCGIVDEYHEHPTNELYDTLETGMGARDQPLMYVVTTAGDNMAGPCYELESYAQKVLQGLAEDEELFACMYGIDPDTDWTSEIALRMANPNYGISISADFLRSKQLEAIARASKQGVFRTKHLNEWVQARQAWMNMEAWGKCGDAPPLDEWKGQPCRLALDLASRTDVAARVQLFETVEDDGKTHFWLYTRFYVPEECETLEKVPMLAAWAKDGYVLPTDGNEIDLQEIEDDIVGEDGIRGEFEITEIAFDPWQATQMRQNIAREAPGVEIIEFRQNTQNFSPAMKELEGAVLSGRFHHDNNPVMNWMMSNVTVKPDARDNIYPRKERPENKIDGPIAALMVLARAMSGEGGHEPSIYDNPELWGEA